MNNPIRYVEAVRHIMAVPIGAGIHLGDMQRAAEAAGFSMLAFGDRLFARDDDAGGKWVKLAITLDMLRC